MSIEYSDGDIFKSGCQALVCPVNCVGVMGKGLALEFKKRWPWYYEDYKLGCSRGYLKIGKVRHFRQEGGPTLISFPTKMHWRDKSLIFSVKLGLVDLKGWFTRHGTVGAKPGTVGAKPPKSIAVPALGCGLGGLKWEEVKPLIEKYLGDLDCRVVVVPPKEVS